MELQMKPQRTETVVSPQTGHLMFSLHPRSSAAPPRWWVHGQPQDQMAVKSGSFLEAVLLVVEVEEEEVEVEEVLWRRNLLGVGAIFSFSSYCCCHELRTRAACTSYLLSLVEVEVEGGGAQVHHGSSVWLSVRDTKRCLRLICGGLWCDALALQGS